MIDEKTREEWRNQSIAGLNDSIINEINILTEELRNNPEADITAKIANVFNMNYHRMISIREKRRRMQNACDQFAGRDENALA